MKAKKILSVIALSLSLSLGLTACGSSASSPSSSSGDSNSAVQPKSAGSGTGTEKSSDELTTVRIAIMTAGASHWYAVVGKESGIFEKHGINLEITEFAAGINTVDAIATGQADIGNLADYACVNRIGNTQENTNLVILDRMSTSEGTADGGLYVNKDRISNLKDLAGEGFATQPGTVWDYWVAKTYEYAGIAEKDQKILNCDSAASAVAIMTSGEASAFWANGVNAAKLEQAGFENILGLDDLGLYTDAYFITSKEFLDEHADVAKEFILAQKETADWIYANEDEAAAIFESATGETQEQFHSDLAATRLVTDFTKETLEHLNGIKEWTVEKGSFGDYNILDFADLTALKADFPDSVTVNE